jgi:two-component system OmpR family sensor kinase
MKLRWLPVLVPALLGITISLWLAQTDAPNPFILIRAQLSVIVLVFCVSISVLAGVSLAVWEWNQRTRIDLTQETTEERHRFLNRLDHEMKNPITAILAGLANLSSAEDEAQRESAQQSVATQVQRLRQLVAELRKLSDLETREIERGPVDLTELLEDAFTITQDQPEAADRHLNMSIPQAPWPLPVIAGDHDLLFLAVYNLLNNAIKFTHPEDTIELRALEDDNHVVIEVADTGPGIPIDEIPHVWEELYRGKGARGVPGSGLGLALVRAIIYRHDGRVSLRSRTGEGTVFTVRLPIGNVTDL